MKTIFEAYWERSGKYISDVLTREAFAKEVFQDAFNIGMAQSRYYTADEEQMPESVAFANGRVVKIVPNTTPGVQHGVYLEVEG